LKDRRSFSISFFGFDHIILLANVLFRASGNVKVSQATEKIKGHFSLEIFGLQSVPHTTLFSKEKLARKNRVQKPPSWHKEKNSRAERTQNYSTK